MKCTNCGGDVKSGVTVCPSCGAQIHYDGKTSFYQKSLSDKLSLKDVFSDMFKKHNRDDLEELFIAGSRTTTPRESEMLMKWRKPWAFVWVFALMSVLSLVSYFLVSQQQPVPLPGYIILAAGIMPVTVLTFFWELNIPRNVPFYEVLLMLLAGGIFSLIVNWLIYVVFPTDALAWMKDGIAAVTEEPAKLLIAALFIKRASRNHILNGVLAGVAVGAGFAMFESAGYILRYSGAFELTGIYWDQFMSYLSDISITRFLGNIGGHALYTGIICGALAIARGRGKLSFALLGKADFWKYAWAPIVAHFLNNMDWFPSIDLGPIDVLRLALSIGLWFEMLMIIKRGVNQAMVVSDLAIHRDGSPVDPAAFVPFSPAKKPQEQQYAAPATPATPSVSMATAVSGPLTGMSFPLGDPVILGRDPDKCSVVFPSNSVGVSRIHCRVEVRSGAVWVKDENATYGTFVDGVKIPSGTWACASQSFSLGSGDNRFELR